VVSFRILHVDDDEDIRFLVELALDPAMNFTLDSYASGDAALAGARVNRPDLALVDVMMPGMDGVTLAAAFRADPSLRDVPVVFVTAKAYPEEVEQLRRAGAVDVLVKPFDLSVLEALIRSLLPHPELG
jgi:two-component system, OmpR family, response regulator